MSMLPLITPGHAEEAAQGISSTTRSLQRGDACKGIQQAPARCTFTESMLVEQRPCHQVLQCCQEAQEVPKHSMMCAIRYIGQQCRGACMSQKRENHLPAAGEAEVAMVGAGAVTGEGASTAASASHHNTSEPEQHQPLEVPRPSGCKPVPHTVYPGCSHLSDSHAIHIVTPSLGTRRPVPIEQAATVLQSHYALVTHFWETRGVSS